MDLPNFLNGIGVAFILAAFFLSTFKIVSGESRIYFVLNLIGGVLASCGAWMIGAIPFVILEITWTVVAIAGLYKTLKTTGR